MVAGDEPVTSPDQHKPTISRRLARLGAIGTILLLVAMAVGGNHEGHTEDYFLIGTAVLLASIMVIDVVLRRNGLRS
jgi:hypothetical protein